MATVKQNIDIRATDKTKRAFSSVNKNIQSTNTGLGSMKKLALAAGGAIAAIGIGKALKSIVDVGMEVENLGVRFKFLFGSAEEGAKAFDTLTKFAGRVPFSLEQISAASGNLAVVVDDAEQLNEVLELTGNIAAVAGIDFKTAGEQVQRALSGGIAAAEIFREKGVKAMAGFADGVQYSAEQTKEVLMKAFGPGGEFGGATKEFAKTLTGTMSMIGDKLYQTQVNISEGFFDELKKQFGDLDKFLEEHSQQIKIIAIAIGTNLAKAMKATGIAVKFVAEHFSILAKVAAALIAMKLAATLFNIARGLTAILVALRATAALTVVGIAAVGASVLAGSVAFIAMTKVIDELEESMHESIVTAEKAAKAQKNLAEIMAESSAGLRLARIKENQEAATSLQAQIQGLKSMGQARLDQVLIEEQAYAKSMQAYAQYGFLRVRGEKLLQQKITKEYNKGLTKQMQGYEDHIVRMMNLKKHEIAHATALDEEAMERAKVRAEFEKKTASDKAHWVIGQGAEIFKGLGAFNEKAFKAYKAFAIAEAIISTAKGAAAQIGSGLPVPFNFIAAAATVAAGLAQVAAIRSQQYGGGKAEGGPVSGNKSYLIGEKGPELFSPGQAGNITPNNKLGQSVNVNFTILANDTRGFDELLVSRRATIQGIINGALNRRGRVGVT
jgi:hypothetical protein